jgi:LysM repeat protein
VHKAQLRQFSSHQLRQFTRRERGLTRHHTVSPGETAWSICNDAGISLAELGDMNRHVALDKLRPGDRLQLPVVLGLQHFSSDPVTLGDATSRAVSSEDASSSSSGSEAGADAWLMISDAPTAASQAGSSGNKWMLAPQGEEPSTSSSHHHSSNGTGHISSSLSNGHATTLAAATHNSSEGGLRFSLGRLFSNSSSRWGVTSSGEEDADSQAPVTSPAAAAVAHAVASGHAPKDSLVAVKIQYPDALGMMTSDLHNLRAVSAFLSKTEIKFDLVSAVDELKKQIHLEFDFMR